MSDSVFSPTFSIDRPISSSIMCFAFSRAISHIASFSFVVINRLKIDGLATGVIVWPVLVLNGGLSVSDSRETSRHFYGSRTALLLSSA